MSSKGQFAWKKLLLVVFTWPKKFLVAEIRTTSSCTVQELLSHCGGVLEEDVLYWLSHFLPMTALTCSHQWKLAIVLLLVYGA